MSKEEIINILEEEALRVTGSYKTAVNINQSGTLNQEKLEKEKVLFFRHITSYLIPELVSTRQDYPIDDISEVDFESNFVIFRKRDYDKIRNFVDQLVGFNDVMAHE